MLLEEWNSSVRLKLLSPNCMEIQRVPCTELVKGVELLIEQEAQ